MRLITLSTDDGPAAHVQVGDEVSPMLREDGFPYRDVREFLASGQDGSGDAQRALESPRVPLEPARLLRPILEPGAIFCVGLNYRNHILEMGRELPAEPTLFSKLPRALTGPLAEITLPSYSPQVDYEGELGVVIGAGGRDLSIDDAWAAIGGLTVVNDVTVRDWQWRTSQWFAGKTGEGLTPVGPAVVTPDAFSDGIGDLELRVTVNGELRQQARLGDLVFDVPHLVADISRFVTLRPGDIIATGTPGGVGAAMKPPRWIGNGDVVEVSIDQVGTLVNTFRDAGSSAVLAVAGVEAEER